MRHIVNIREKKNFSPTRRHVFLLAFLFQLIMVSSLCFWTQLNSNNPLQFQTTPQQLKQFALVEMFRNQMVFKKLTVENNVLAHSYLYRIMYKKNVAHTHEESFYGVAAEAKYIGPAPNGHSISHNFNGPMNLMFGRTNSAIFDISPQESLYAEVVNIRNYVEHGSEFYACASFDVETKTSMYNMKVTQGCMMLKDLLYRWGSASRHFIGELPKVIPPEAEGAMFFGIAFNREQPCHMSANYWYSNTTARIDQLLHSVPLKDVTCEPTVGSRHGYVDLIGTYFDGSLIEMKKISYDYLLEQSVKKYHESNRIYPLKMKVGEDKDSSTKGHEFGNSTVDTDMWVHGANFKYDVSTKLCYMVNIGVEVFLDKNNAGFFVDRTNGNIVFNLYINDDIYFLTTEKYTLLIENDSKLCGIPYRNMTQN